MVAEAGGGGFGSEAVIGIVVAAICVLLIVIGAVIGYIICRMRRQAAKNTTTPNPQTDHHTGQALPVDIPIEAITRVPPPSYAPPPRQPHTQRRHSRPSVRTSGTTGQNGTSFSPPPPPYAAAVSGAIATIDINCDEAPPEYRSRVGLNSSVGNIEQITNNHRTISVDSFTEYPSMRNIVQTSSRSSLQGTDSRHASQSDRSSAGPSARAGRLSGGGDSARGDSVESRSSRSDDPTNLRQYHRAISSSSSALYDPRLSIPEGGLQRRVRKTKQQQQQQSTPTAVQVNTEMNRSCPSLVSDDTDNPSRSGNGRESHTAPAQKGGGHRRQRSTEADSASSPASAAAAIQKRRRYKRKDGSAKSQRLSTSTEYSGDLENQFQFNGRGHAYGTDTSASSLPSLSSPVTRFQVAGTCDV